MSYKTYSDTDAKLHPTVKALQKAGHKNITVTWQKATSMAPGWTVSTDKMQSKRFADVSLIYKYINQTDPAKTIVVEIPSTMQHSGMNFYLRKVRIPNICPQCGKKRAVKYWRGLSYDGSLRLSVDCWENECGHTDKYSDVIKEGIQVPSGTPSITEPKMLTMATLIEYDLIKTTDVVVIFNKYGEPTGLLSFYAISPTTEPASEFSATDLLANKVTRFSLSNFADIAAPLSKFNEKDELYIIGNNSIDRMPRYLCQKGKIEGYCPGIFQNTMGHSKSGGEEVYLLSTMAVKKPSR